MRGAMLLLLLAGAGHAKPQPWPDEVHPRSPSTPLEIQFLPYWCSRCLEEGILTGEKKPVTMMRMPVEKLVQSLEMSSWIVMETPHFKLLTDLPKSKVKWKDSTFVRADFERLKQIFPKITAGREGADVDPHERAHLYHIRIERLYSHFAALTDCKQAHLGMLAPYEVYLFDDYAQQHALCDRYLGKVNDKAGIQDHQREEPNYMLFTTCASQVGRNDGGGDKIFSNHVMHNVAHILADGYANYYRETWAWLEEGLAHYYERRENPRHNTFCWTEGKKPDDFLKENWDETLANLVRRGKDTNFGEWCEKLQPGELGGVEQGMCWSIVRWMVETEPVRFTKLLDRQNDYQAKATASQALEFAFGASPSVLHQRWREWLAAQVQKKQ